MHILTLNAGSSTLKFAAFAGGALDEQVSGVIDWRGSKDAAELTIRHPDGSKQRSSIQAAGLRGAVPEALRALESASGIRARDCAGVGHRVVHGGTAYRASVRIDRAVKGTIAQLAELAPLHNPPALEVLEAAGAALPDVPQVAVFDTAFHATLPPSQFLYPLPYEWYSAWGIRRFGFHGISHAYCAGRAAEVLRTPLEQLRLVICHIGNGCSASAVQQGKCLATSMGFTPLDGLMMGTRPGALDPGILLHVLKRQSITLAELEDSLNHQSGLLGVSGVSADYREVEAAAESGNERAQLALEIYASRIRSTIGGLTVTLGGLDALVFTAGVGENSAALRKQVCAGLECLGIALDPLRNDTARPDADIAAQPSRVRILILHTREDLLIARDTARLLAP